MERKHRFAPPLALLAAAVCFFAPPVHAGGQAASARAASQWDAAFTDRSGATPLHLTAQYVDAHGTTHRLEEWRLGQRHLRRLTDDRIDLHADAAGRAVPGQAVEYTWQILDLQRRIAHRVSTVGMLHVGMFYSYYSMAHLLTRPSGSFSVRPSSQPAAGPSSLTPNKPLMARYACRWWQIDSPGQPSTRVCWLPKFGVPAQTWSQTPSGWRLVFQVETLEQHALPESTFVADTTGFQVRDLDEIQAED